jgi:hypothetical protein
VLKWLFDLFKPKRPVRRPISSQPVEDRSSERRSKFDDHVWRESVWEKSMNRETWLNGSRNGK